MYRLLKYSAWVVVLFFVSYLCVPSRRLLWSDEFDGGALDASKWNYEENYRHSAQNTRSAVRVGEGNLIIKAYRIGGIYYTGIVNTKEKFSLSSGYIEARVSFGAKVNGHWAAMWLYDDKHPRDEREIDIFEHRSFDINGKNIQQFITSAYHWNGYFEGARSLGTDSGDRGLGIGYHIYGVELSPSGYTYFIDGERYWHVDAKPSNDPFYLIFSVELKNVFSEWTGPLPEELDDDMIIIDWVRVYDKRK